VTGRLDLNHIPAGWEIGLDLTRRLKHSNA